jgi:hypothetical protein
MQSRNIELNLPSSIPTSAAVRTRPSGKVGQSGGSLDTMMLLIEASTKKVYVCFYVLLELASIFFCWQDPDVRQTVILKNIRMFF